MSKLFTIYGARKSRTSDERVNITLVTGEKESKEWANVSLKLNTTGKTKAKIQDKFLIVKIPLLEENNEDSMNF